MPDWGEVAKDEGAIMVQVGVITLVAGAVWQVWWQFLGGPPPTLRGVALFGAGLLVAVNIAYAFARALNLMSIARANAELVNSSDMSAMEVAGRMMDEALGRGGDDD